MAKRVASPPTGGMTRALKRPIRQMPPDVRSMAVSVGLIPADVSGGGPKPAPKRKVR